ncbi:MAG: hypothetical protein AAFN77_22425 [Planctomycetota bacterium]
MKTNKTKVLLAGLGRLAFGLTAVCMLVIPGVQVDTFVSYRGNGQVAKTKFNGVYVGQYEHGWPFVFLYRQTEVDEGVSSTWPAFAEPTAWTFSGSSTHFYWMPLLGSFLVVMAMGWAIGHLIFCAIGRKFRVLDIVVAMTLFALLAVVLKRELSSPKLMATLETLDGVELSSEYNFGQAEMRAPPLCVRLLGSRLLPQKYFAPAFVRLDSSVDVREFTSVCQRLDSVRILEVGSNFQLSKKNLELIGEIKSVKELVFLDQWSEEMHPLIDTISKFENLQFLHGDFEEMDVEILSSKLPKCIID